MNVYTRITGWGAAVTLTLLTAVLILDVWLMSMLSALRHGVGYVLLQIAMVAILLRALSLIFGRRTPPG